jgi:hypothetical protein
LGLLAAGLVFFAVATRNSEASLFSFKHCGHSCNGQCCGNENPSGIQLSGEPGQTWYWMRSPEEQKRVVIGLYSRYCIRCHGVDGRGIWDIPGVPDFTNASWQACRSDGQLARVILEGRGACMPPFRGTLTLEEAWAMGQYLRTFVPGTEVSRPDVSQPERLPSPGQK